MPTAIRAPNSIARKGMTALTRFHGMDIGERVDVAPPYEKRPYCENNETGHQHYQTISSALATAEIGREYSGNHQYKREHEY